MRFYACCIETRDVKRVRKRVLKNYQSPFRFSPFRRTGTPLLRLFLLTDSRLWHLEQISMVSLLLRSLLYFIQPPGVEPGMVPFNLQKSHKPCAKKACESRKCR